jgi:hypothetical protein
LATDDGRTADAPSRNRQPVPEVCNDMIAQLRILLCECLIYTKRRQGKIIKLTMFSISVNGISSTVRFEPCASSIIPRYDFPFCLHTQPNH